MKHFFIILLLCTIAAANELPIKKGSDRFHENGQLKRVKLKQPTLVQGYPCMRWLRFFENGAIEQFQTAEDVEIQPSTRPSSCAQTVP